MHFVSPAPARSPRTALLDHGLTAVAVAAIAWVEDATRDELEVSGFFLLPVLWVTRRRGAGAGVAWSLVVAGTWFTVDRWSRQDVVSPLVLAANQVVRLVVNLAAVRLLTWVDQARRDAERASETDALTGLLNRRGFWSAAARELERQRRTGETVTVACLDLDGFKAHNDARGHAAGDRALQEVARILRLELRATDVTARLGGDEFVALLPATSPQVAERVLGRLHQALGAALASCSPGVGVSIGIASCPRAPASLDAALRLADAALYRAKRSGKNRLVSTADEPAIAS
ncbi:MAG: GGDEF domain-containing protein [Myxococcaceae bacterium]|nr:GGDEF domain-containing protein [Myxococcaceae bacterium]